MVKIEEVTHNGLKLFIRGTSVSISRMWRGYVLCRTRVNENVAPSLIACVNRYCREKIPENYTVEFIPYDWMVNAK